jgi:ABC-type Zn uptake system ZnuABC Zn-binding protein ZnuA
MKLKKADLLIVAGLDLDIWIQSLIDASRNPKIRFGEDGYIDPSEGIIPLNVPKGRIDGSMGDVHPYGNPHYWHTPKNVITAAQNIYNGLTRIDPENKGYYTKNKNKYIEKIKTTYKKLAEKMKPYKGTKVIQFHQSWDYFCDTFELEIIGEVEPKPGIPPTPGHLKELVKRIKMENAKLMLAEPYYPAKPIEFVKRSTDIEVLRLPNYLGSKKDNISYLENLEYNVNTIIKTLKNR